MSAAANKQKNEAMAAYMKSHPSQFPDSYRRPWRGAGSDIREIARSMGSVPPSGSTWERGMLGGILAARLGYGDANVPLDLRSAAE